MDVVNGHGALEETGQELAVLLDRARFLLELMRSNAGRPPAAPAPEGQIAALEEEIRALETRALAAEQQNERLMRLYVASFQLHASLDPAEVLANISEIVVNLVGADRFVLLLSDPSGGPSSIVLRHGFDEELSERSLMRFAGRLYPGGDAQLDATLADGRMRWGQGEGTPVLAAIPLNVNGRTVGAIALLAAQSYARAERKLRKLAGILSPARRIA